MCGFHYGHVPIVASPPVYRVARVGMIFISIFYSYSLIKYFMMGVAVGGGREGGHS